MIVPHPVFDQIADGPDFHVVLAREGDEVVQPGHRAIVLHDLADHAGRIEPGKARDINGGLGMAGTHQNAAVASRQWEDMAGGDDVLRALGRVDRHGHCARPVGGADPGGDAGFGLDRGRESRLHAFPIVAAHGLKAERLHPLTVQRETDETATVRCHEIDRIGCGHLCRDHQIAFILPILVIDENKHAAIARFVDNLFRTDDNRRLVIRFEKAFELGQRIGGGIPAVLGAISQSVGMKARTTCKAGTGHQAVADDRANFFDRVHQNAVSHRNVTHNGASH